MFAVSVMRNGYNKTGLWKFKTQSAAVKFANALCKSRKANYRFSGNLPFENIGAWHFEMLMINLDTIHPLTGMNTLCLGLHTDRETKQTVKVWRECFAYRQNIDQWLVK